MITNSLTSYIRLSGGMSRQKITFSVSSSPNSQRTSSHGSNATIAASLSYIELNGSVSHFTCSFV